MSRAVLDCRRPVSAATSSKDVDVAKPDPTIIEIAHADERASTPTTPSMSATRCGTSSRAVAPACPPSDSSVAAYHGRTRKRWR